MINLQEEYEEESNLLIIFFAILLCGVIMLMLSRRSTENGQKTSKVKNCISVEKNNLLKKNQKINPETIDNDRTIIKIEDEGISVNFNFNENNQNNEDTDLIEIVQKNTKQGSYATIKIPLKEEIEKKQIAIKRLVLILTAIRTRKIATENKKTADVSGQNNFLKINNSKDKNMKSFSEGMKNGNCYETVEIVMEQINQAEKCYAPLTIIHPKTEVKCQKVIRKKEEDSITFDFNKSVRDYLNEIEIKTRDELTYIEPKTNISRFKKSEGEYSKKIFLIADHHTELDGFSKEFSYFLHYDISGDLRAIDTLYKDDGKLADGYTVWVDLLKHGKLYFPYSSTFAIVLLHMIINRLIIENTDWAIIIMACIWNRYYPDFQHKEILMWIKDYWITYENQLSYKDFKSLFKYEITFQGDKIDAGINQVDMSCLEKECMLDFFNENSDYRIKKGRTVEEGYGALLEECLLNVVKRLRMVFEEEGKRLEDYFKISEIENYEKKRDVFRRAILSEHSKKYIRELNRKFIVSDNEKSRITVENGMAKIIFTRKRFTYDKSRLFVENIGKITELQLRNWIGISAKFIVSIDDLTNLFNLENSGKLGNVFSNRMVNSIEEAVEEVCKKKGIPKSSISKNTINHLLSNKKTNIPDTLNDKDFSIDIGKLDKIRNDAETVKEKLIVDETNFLSENVQKKEKEIKDEIELVKKDELTTVSEVNEWDDLWNELTQKEKELLFILIEAENTERILKISTLIKECGILLEVFVEAINEKAIEIVGDNILEYSSELPQIYDDYIEEISTVLQKK